MRYGTSANTPGAQALDAEKKASRDEEKTVWVPTPRSRSLMHVDVGETKPYSPYRVDDDATSKAESEASPAPSSELSGSQLVEQARSESFPFPLPSSTPTVPDAQSSDTVVCEAEAVDSRAEARARARERETIRLETIREIEENAAQAEVVDDEWEQKKRRQSTLLLYAVALISIVFVVVVGSVVGTRDRSPTPLTVEDYVRIEFGDDGKLTDETTPQRASIDWMTDTDQYLVYPLETEEQLVSFRQRYVMCVLAFSTDILNWKSREGWANPETSDCQWSGITCDNRGRLNGINLG